MGRVSVKGPSSLISQGEKSVMAPHAFLGVLIFANKSAPKTHSLFHHFQSTIHATTVKQATKALHDDGCNWQSHWAVRRAILVGVAVLNVQKCHHSAVRTCVSQGTSLDKIQHYRSIVDQYKISEREGVIWFTTQKSYFYKICSKKILPPAL
jgi:hypothetical protein